MPHRICYIKGDGIGKDVIHSALDILEVLNLHVELTEAEAGYECYRGTGTPLPEDTIKKCRKADAVLFGAVTTPPDIPSYRSPIITLRKDLRLYANLRPVVSLPIPDSRQDVDIIIVRENTEGLYSGVEREDEETAITERIITRTASERIARFAFDLAKNQGREKVTIIHKANIMRKTCGLFRRIAFDVSIQYAHIEAEEMLVDAAAMKLIKNPEHFDVILTTNMFGDILSDEASALVGGLGIAASANMGDKAAVFEPVHGSAPMHAGQNTANPTATLFAMIMMLEHLGEKTAAKRLADTIVGLLAKKICTRDLGGSLGTREFTDKIMGELK